jgi:hypothetical protein
VPGRGVHAASLIRVSLQQHLRTQDAGIEFLVFNNVSKTDIVEFHPLHLVFLRYIPSPHALSPARPSLVQNNIARNDTQPPEKPAIAHRPTHVLPMPACPVQSSYDSAGNNVQHDDDSRSSQSAPASKKEDSRTSKLKLLLPKPKKASLDQKSALLAPLALKFEPDCHTQASHQLSSPRQIVHKTSECNRVKRYRDNCDSSDTDIRSPKKRPAEAVGVHTVPEHKYWFLR